MKRSRVAVAVALSGAILAVSGCGGSSDSGTSPTEEWATGVCTALTTWTSSISSLGDTLKEGDLSKDTLQGAVDDAVSATRTLTDDLESLGKPDTESGQKAQEALDQLATDLDEDAQAIEDAVAGVSGLSGVLAAVSTIGSSIASMGESVQSTFQDLESLDARGDLEEAFSNSSACDPLTK